MYNAVEFQAMWSRTLMVAFFEFCAVVYLAYLGLTVYFFIKRETSIGVICATCAILCFAQPFGIVFGLIFGWINARRWGIRGFMSLFTLLVVIAALNCSAAFILRSMSLEQVRRLFHLRA